MSRMNRSTFEGLIKENLEWLAQQPRTLEREHIRVIVEQSPTAFYGADAEEMAALKARADAAQKKLEALAKAADAVLKYREPGPVLGAWGDLMDALEAATRAARGEP